MKISKVIREMLGIEKPLERLKFFQKSVDAHLRSTQELYPLLNKEVPDAENFVVPMLRGGLGNQMFQIAAACAQAGRTGAKLAINYPRCIDPIQQGSRPVLYKDSFYKNISETSHWPSHAYEYWGFIFWPILPVKNIALKGLFHSSKYFAGFEEEIRRLFVFPDEVQSEVSSFLARDSRPTVGIHVRLGDFLCKEHRESLYVCTPHYFRNAIRPFSGAGYRFIICSDEPETARGFFKGMDVEIFRGAGELSDMCLLSRCNNLIISNSTFSWWAAYLGVKKEKVVAPDRWFGVKNHQLDADVFEPGWIKVRTK